VSPVVESDEAARHAASSTTRRIPHAQDLGPTAGTDCDGARTASLDAARDPFTAGSVQYNAVTTAWSAVGVS
jgi:Zn-dependent metalloprotease